MNWVWTIIVALLAGVILGPLGRALAPGEQKIGIGMTILVGVGGSFLGGLVGYFLTGGRRAGGWILGVLGAALIVWLIERSQQRRAY